MLKKKGRLMYGLLIKDGFGKKEALQLRLLIQKRKKLVKTRRNIRLIEKLEKKIKKIQGGNHV